MFLFYIYFLRYLTLKFWLLVLRLPLAIKKKFGLQSKERKLQFFYMMIHHLIIAWNWTQTERIQIGLRARKKKRDHCVILTFYVFFWCHLLAAVTRLGRRTAHTICLPLPLEPPRSPKVFLLFTEESGVPPKSFEQLGSSLLADVITACVLPFSLSHKER